MRILFNFLATMLMAAGVARGAEVFMAPTGNDANPGTIDQPILSIGHAMTLVGPGDTVWLRGGTYANVPFTTITTSGTSGSMISILNYPGESPVLDFTGNGVGNVGLRIEAGFLHMRGITLANAAKSGMHVWLMASHNNLFENLVATGNKDTGIYISTQAADNTFLNCDSYANYDPQDNGENADGFGAKFHIGPGNVFVGCRAWENSDDGFDCWMANNAVYFENCYAWRNGNDIGELGSAFQGDGDGFKLGQDGGAHLLVRCATWDPNNGHYGFDLNGNTEGVTLYNTMALRCSPGLGYRFITGTNYANNRLRNNVSMLAAVSLNPAVDDDGNSWSPGAPPLTDEDYIKLTNSELEGARLADGSLPEGDFMRLVEGSPGIDAGEDVGISFLGTAPDFAPFEFKPITGVRNALAWRYGE